VKKSIVKKLEQMREQLADMREFLDDLAGSARDRLDNATGWWADSEAGQKCSEELEDLEQAAGSIESAESAIQNVVSS
jgi:predicted component of type VI protein secretion system